MVKKVCVFVVLLDGDLVQSPEHLGVSYLIAVLRRADHTCHLLDMSIEDEDGEIERLIRLNPSFVGISLTTVNFPRAIRLGKIVRDRLGSDVHICAGGPIATFMGKDLLFNDSWRFLDSIIRGEGEYAILHLINKLGTDENLDAVPGLTTRFSLESCKQVTAVDELDELPWPARDQLNRYHEMGKRFPYVRISTSRGCTSFCTFCNAPHVRNNLAKSKVWRGRSPYDIIEEIKYLNKKYGVDTFDFVDSTFEDPGPKGKERITKIANLILENDLKIYYNICSQAKNWHEEDNELLHLLYRSGLEKVLIGIESGSNRMLQLFKKKSSLEDNNRAIGLFKRNNVYVAFGFIMFTPFSHWGDIDKNVDFLLEHMGHNLRRFITRLEIYPGAEILNQIKNNGLLSDDYWTSLNPYGYTYLDPEIEKVALTINQFFGKEYLIRGSIRKEPAVFKFETFDITLHTYLSRLERRYATKYTYLDRIIEGKQEIERIRRELTQFNGTFFFDLVDRIRNEKGIPSNYQDKLEDKYIRAINDLKQVQLKLGMNIKRHALSSRHVYM